MLIYRLDGQTPNKIPAQNNSCSLIPSFPPAIKLICPSKQKVYIPTNAKESTSCKQMQKQNGAN